jgi:predicted PurR-regulated permease PerM
MADVDPGARRRDQLTSTWVEIAIRIGVLGLLLYFAFLLVQPFITIAIWAIVLAVAVYPAYDRMVGWLGGRRRLAAVLLTLLGLLILLGPATWLALSLIEGISSLSHRLDAASFTIPSPPTSVKEWPLIGPPIYQFWELASTNLQAAVAKVAPQLRPVGGSLLAIAAGAGTGALQFVIALIVAGFLFPPAPTLVDALNRFSRRLASDRGEAFVQITGATIRAIARGVIGVAALQSFLIGCGLVVAGIPGASLLTLACLLLGIIQIGPAVVIFPVLGIIQIGPALIIFPVIIWAWTAMDTVPALLFTVYMIPVNLLDNVLRPLVMGRGLGTPIVVILIGLIGGTISLGLTGLFLGPIVLAVIWELLVAWIRERESEA